jgi:hypothetical protein
VSLLRAFCADAGHGHAELLIQNVVTFQTRNKPAFQIFSHTLLQKIFTTVFSASINLSFLPTWPVRVLLSCSAGSRHGLRVKIIQLDEEKIGFMKGC